MRRIVFPGEVHYVVNSKVPTVAHTQTPAKKVCAKYIQKVEFLFPISFTKVFSSYCFNIAKGLKGIVTGQM